WTTKEGTLYFLAVDSTGHFESAPPVCWKAEIDIRHQVEVRGEERYVTLQATPRAEIFYTLEGENPKNNGTPYTEPFPIDNKRRVLQVFARAGEANKQRNFVIPDRHDQRITLDETKPARFTRRISLDTQEKIAKVCDTFRDQKESFFCAPRIELGEGEETITVRFGRRHVTFEEIEQVSKALRDVFDPDRQARLLIESKEIRFETGHDLKKFAEIAEIELRPSEVEPDNA
ncbi:MAG: chitobiase/beta-hexosaminidase C-terminal domain-containing protein, partial [Acetobacter sp.]|nr:chitobiase/beta-hexosaminidase C-terminal domain-containing protein [Acetobacter sp.]